MKSKLNFRQILTPSLLGVAMGLAAAGAGAATVGECKGYLDLLLLQVQSAELIGHNAEKDLAGLAGKVTEAGLKLDSGKFADSIQKLDDFQIKLGQLVGSGKISSTNYSELFNSSNTAETCIGQLGR